MAKRKPLARRSAAAHKRRRPTPRPTSTRARRATHAKKKSHGQKVSVKRSTNARLKKRIKANTSVAAARRGTIRSRAAKRGWQTRRAREARERAHAPYTDLDDFIAEYEKWDGDYNVYDVETSADY